MGNIKLFAHKERVIVGMGQLVGNIFEGCANENFSTAFYVSKN